MSTDGSESLGDDGETGGRLRLCRPLDLKGCGFTVAGDGEELLWPEGPKEDGVHLLRDGRIVEGGKIVEAAHLA